MLHREEARGIRETWTDDGNSNFLNQPMTGYEALLVVQSWSSGEVTRRVARGSTWW